ncbi:keratin, type I cytoskeletal 18-like [Rhinophrynus dorsalis]
MGLYIKTVSIMASVCSVRGGSFSIRSSSASLSHDRRPCAISAASVCNASPTLLNGVNEEKEVMQNLNFRLANYLEKVCSLEKSNKQLETLIREKLSVQPVKKDYSAQFSLIKTLQGQIASSVSENTKLLLDIDNNKLAADDFQVKWSTESVIRQSVEKDMSSLRKVKDDHKSMIFSMEAELESLKSELKALKNNHAKSLYIAVLLQFLTNTSVFQEVAMLKDSLASAKVNVEVDAVQGPDLNSILSEIRSQYEDIIKRNKEEADALFQSQYDTVNQKLERENKEVQSAQIEVREKQSVLQGLELELESLRNQVNVLKRDLDSTDLRYRNELDRLQNQVSLVEQELAEVVQTVHNNKLEYEALLKIKETLEAEIKEYRRLLDGEYEEKVIIPEPREPDIRTKKIVKIVTQTLVDGKLVNESSEVEEFENAEKTKTHK